MTVANLGGGSWKDWHRPEAAEPLDAVDSTVRGGCWRWRWEGGEGGEHVFERCYHVFGLPSVCSPVLHVLEHHCDPDQLLLYVRQLGGFVGAEQAGRVDEHEPPSGGEAVVMAVDVEVEQVVLRACEAAQLDGDVADGCQPSRSVPCARL